MRILKTPMMVKGMPLDGDGVTDGGAGAAVEGTGERLDDDGDLGVLGGRPDHRRSGRR